MVNTISDDFSPVLSTPSMGYSVTPANIMHPLRGLDAKAHLRGVMAAPKGLEIRASTFASLVSTVDRRLAAETLARYHESYRMSPSMAPP